MDPWLDSELDLTLLAGAQSLVSELFVRVAFQTYLIFALLSTGTGRVSVVKVVATSCKDFLTEDTFLLVKLLIGNWLACGRVELILELSSILRNALGSEEGVVVSELNRLISEIETLLLWVLSLFQ